MGNNYMQFYESKNKKIKEFELNANVNLFLDEVQRLYPSMLKLFEVETKELISGLDFFKKFNQLKKHVFDNILPKIENFSVGLQSVDIRAVGQIQSHPLNNPIKFMEKYLNVDKSNPNFYLILSFLLLPQNYDIIQLCDKKFIV